ncbi:GMC oxidoreductase [Amnibacterium flavum]|uniref:Pyranose oxidase n=1 Tax=Amnibacterium flavum TaxID=2173173 RepID=A0A2V1HT34_9MICO|nr:GMC oxidoreductase [Amnibacterium flavum]PVZ95733.1 pyranose oxidase precursor [Amnibacterium flavum]
MSEQSGYDLIIVGSGPAGSAVAREVSAARPDARILMVERGPQTTPLAGESVRNLSGELRANAERLAQGPNADGRTTVSDSRQGRPVARPGTFLIGEMIGDDPQTNMPGALASAGVGGMGQHWTCACPLPGNTERVPFIPGDELDALLDRAGELLHVTQDAYPESGVRAAVERALGEFFNEGRPADRRVQAMPLAATPTPSGRPRWSGADTVLGELADEATRPESFELRASTLARRVLLDDSGAVRGLEIEDRVTGERSEVEAPQVVVAADAFGSPQLLWASGIRPRALGHYLNDQPQVMCSVYLDPSIAPPDQIEQAADSEREAMTGVSWIPFNAPDYPFHGQIMQRDAAPMIVGDVESDDRRPIVGLGCFTTKDIRFEDHIEFSESEVDFFGMPAPKIHYELTDVDRATINRALGIVSGLVEKMGVPVPGGHPRLVPAGSSIHYQGTVRMGEDNDGESVSDPWGRVWDVPGLYVAGNGVIPTPTASNPTVTTVALAVRTAGAVLEDS